MDAWKALEEAERAIDGPVMSLAGSDLGRAWRSSSVLSCAAVGGGASAIW